MTPEQIADRQSVWDAIAEHCPEFTHNHDAGDNYHAVREIVLGGSITWRAANGFFFPRPGKRVMDVGANAGVYTAFCGIHGCKVTAYEPFPTAYDLVSGMVQRTGLTENVKVLPVAIWTYHGQVRYLGHKTPNEDVTCYNGGVGSSGVNWTADDAHRSLTVPCIPFSEAIGSEFWDCVKMDIEGAEYEVLLATPAEALKKIRFMYVEFHDWASQILHDETIDKLRAVFDTVQTFRGREDMPKYECGYCFNSAVNQ